jgi:hypothetical protein
VKENSWRWTMKRYDESVKRQRRKTLLIGGLGIVIVTLLNVAVNKYLPKIDKEA